MDRKPMARCKITVLKTLYHEDLVTEYLLPEKRESYKSCYRHSIGQEFIVDSFNKPDNFCSWAWADIHREIIAIMCNADFPASIKPGLIIASCTDGLRPVIFKLEKMEPL